MRLDNPHYEGGKLHVHVYKDGNEIASENMDGSPSHGSSLDSLPSKVKERVKNHPQYKRKKGKIKERRSIIENHVPQIQNAINEGREYIIIGGMAISVCVLLEWAAKVGLIFLFAL